MHRARIRTFAAAIVSLTLAALAAESGATKKPPATAPAKPAAPAAQASPQTPPMPSQRKPRYPKVGSAAPNFEFTALNGTKFRFLDFRRGKTVVLVLFEQGCGPCQKELQRIETEIAQPMGKDGVTVLAIARDGRADELKPLKKNMKVTFPMAEDPQGMIYGVFAAEKEVPRTYVIDRRGSVAFESTGYDEAEFPKLVEAVKKASAKPAAGAKPASDAKPAAEKKPAEPAKPAAEPATTAKPAAPAKKK